MRRGGAASALFSPYFRPPPIRRAAVEEKDDFRLLDVAMPIMDGLSVLSPVILRVSSSTKIVIMSSYAPEWMADDALALGTRAT
jgi:YesN/AraC family two-component response regulator